MPTAANTIINFDFPLNPMRIEQRIGRIDRSYKDRKNIFIYNFLTKGTIEEYIYAILSKKLEIFQQIIGKFVPPITPLKLTNGPSVTLTGSPTTKEILGLGLLWASWVLFRIFSTSSDDSAVGVFPDPIKPVTPGEVLTKIQVFSFRFISTKI